VAEEGREGVVEVQQRDGLHFHQRKTGFRFLSGGPFGWIVGYYFAAFGVVRWLFYIPVTPVLESWSSYSTCSSSTGLPSTLSTSTSVDLLQAVQGARETSERDPDGCTFIPDFK
jgi:hypothetical protein